MRWAILAVAAALIAALVLRFSRTAAALVVAGAVAIGGFAWIQQRGIDRAMNLIPASQVELRDLRLTQPDHSSRELQGRIRNGSPVHTITEVALEITVDACADRRCSPVDQARVIVRGPIPPLSERDIDQRVVFTALVSPQADYVPHFRLIYVKAR